MLKRTQCYDRHVSLGAKIVEFAGWEMPVQYGDIREEHKAVRTHAGLFDVSHMGEIWVRGKGAKDAVQSLICNSIAKQQDGQVVYSPLTNPQGGCVDDILVYRYDEERLLLVVNASNSDKDFAWISSQIGGTVSVTNHSDDYGQLALQGPKAQELLQTLTPFELSELKFFRFAETLVAEKPALISRTGYTGEDGFEIYLYSTDTAEVWDALLATGAHPIGLGARDTLRLEAALPLYGHELAMDISPLEAGLGRFVKLGGADFCGKAALAAQKESGAPRRLIGFELVDRGIARAEYPVQSAGEIIGHVTSGTPSPTLGTSIGMALVRGDWQGETLEILVRGKPLAAKVVPLPFYQKQYKK